MDKYLSDALVQAGINTPEAVAQFVQNAIAAGQIAVVLRDAGMTIGQLRDLLMLASLLVQRDQANQRIAALAEERQNAMKEFDDQQAALRAHIEQLELALRP